MVNSLYIHLYVLDNIFVKGLIPKSWVVKEYLKYNFCRYKQKDCIQYRGNDMKREFIEMQMQIFNNYIKIKAN